MLADFHSGFGAQGPDRWAGRSAGREYPYGAPGGHALPTATTHF